MSDLPRLNGLIRALEAGGHAFGAFTPADIGSAVNAAASKYDGVIIEMEHNPWDVNELRIALQFMLDRKEIAAGGTLPPRVTPICRIPPNGGEMNQWFAKQALDLGCYGIVWPHVSTVEQARNAVAACRYPRLPTAPHYDPPGLRGDGPKAAARYWGLTQQEYYARADVWPLNPKGEILVILMIEDLEGIANLPAMLREVPGIGLILIGEGDLSQELGVPRQYEHPSVLAEMNKVLEACTAANVPVGHPHVDAKNAERIIAEGYRFLMTAPTTSYANLDAARRLAGRT
jgi:4-hydroxy-2-oxoheptanedioate aldolase